MVKQKIIIVNSKLYEAIETIALFLHIITLLVGFLTFVSIIEVNHYSLSVVWNEVLEAMTMIFVSIIIFIHFFQPLLKRKIIKKHLISFWGEVEMSTIVSQPSEISHDKSRIIGNVTEEISSSFRYLTKTSFKRKGFKINLVIERKKMLSGTGEDKVKFSPFSMIPSYIIVDIKEGKIEMTNKITFLNGKNYKVPRHLYFDYVNKTVHWSGQFPDVPYYGRWEWK